MGDIGNPQPNGDQEAKPPRRRWNATEPFFDFRASHWVEVALTIALLCVGASQLYVYWRQAGIMKTQADIAARQNEITIATNRAIINFRPMADTQGVGTDDYSFRLGNDGNVTTKGLTIAVDCIWSDTAKDEPFDLLGPNPNEVVPDVIAPKQEVPVYGSHPANCRVDAFRLQQLISGRHLYFLGNIHYRDGIEPKRVRVTQFAKELVLNAIPSQVVKPADFRAVASAISRGRHNCADDDCPNN